MSGPTSYRRERVAGVEAGGDLGGVEVGGNATRLVAVAVLDPGAPGGALDHLGRAVGIAEDPGRVAAEVGIRRVRRRGRRLVIADVGRERLWAVLARKPLAPGDLIEGVGLGEAAGAVIARRRIPAGPGEAAIAGCSVAGRPIAAVPAIAGSAVAGSAVAGRVTATVARRGVTAIGPAVARAVARAVAGRDRSAGGRVLGAVGVGDLGRGRKAGEAQDGGEEPSLQAHGIRPRARAAWHRRAPKCCCRCLRRPEEERTCRSARMQV